MSRNTAWVRCVCCDEVLDTNDTERLVHIDGDGLAHRACYEREQQREAMEVLTRPETPRTYQRINA